MVVEPPAPGRAWLKGRKGLMKAPDWLKALCPEYEP
jgi:hypothetical protein